MYLTKKIVIVGGGFSGIGAIRMLQEVGLESVCFELTDKHGGTWSYRDEVADGIPSIMSTTVINISKELGAFSNFPPRKEYNNFMRHSELFQYMTEFVEKYDLLKHMQYNSKVTLVKRADDHDATGRWEVSVQNTLTGEETTQVFDGVMVCVGHVNRPKMPNYPGQDDFEGQIMHTHSLKRFAEFQDKTVVVVGMGCSGLDAAVEISSLAKQVHLSTRSGAHAISRIGPYGYPIDHVLVRRYLYCIMATLLIKLSSWLVETLFLDPQFDHKLYAVQPSEPFLCKDPSVNDAIGSKLLSGSVIQTHDIERFTKTGVIFKGDTQETQADVVIMATGYSWKFPFLVEGIVVQEEGRFNLYKSVFPPHLQRNTLAIIGFVIPFGPGFPLGEIQLRWTAAVLSGERKLPSKEEMLKDISRKHAKNLLRFNYSDKTSLRVDYIDYMDEIASQIGVKPNLLKLFFTDMKLFIKLVFGPCLPYQYRLQGPHHWEGARDTIMTSSERLHWPMQKRAESEDAFWMQFIKRILKMLLSN